MSVDDVEKVYEEMSQKHRHELNAFYQLRSLFAPLIEGLILLDRLTFLLQQVTNKLFNREHRFRGCCFCCCLSYKVIFFRKSTTSCKYYKKNLKTPYNSEKGKSPYFEGILPKIAIAIPIPISIVVCDRRSF